MAHPALLALALSLSAQAADRPPGDLVDPAVMIDITPSGFDKVGLLASDLLPGSTPLASVAASDAAPQDCINLIFTSVCWIPWRYAYNVHDFDVGIELTDLSIVPHTDQLVLDVVVTFNVNSAAAPGRLDLSAQVADVNLFGIKFTVLDIHEQCKMWLDPTPITAHTAITLQVNPQGVGLPPLVVVDVAPLQVDLDLHGLRIQDCVLQDILDFVNAVNGFLGGVFGFDIYDTLTDLITPILNNALGSVLGGLEQQIQTAFRSLAIDQTVDVLGKKLRIAVSASDLDITDDGLRAILSGAISGTGTPDPCVSKYGIQGSKATGGRIPAIGESPSGVTPDLALFVDDDLINEALFAVWYEGLLCVDLSADGPLPIDLPIPLDTSLLGLLAGDAYKDLFPVAAPLRIVTAPAHPPVATMGGDHAINLKLRDMGLDFYAELDGRYARMVGIDVGATIGADLTFDSTDGKLAAGLDVGSNAFTFVVGFNELRPEANAKMEAGLSGLVGTIVGPLLGGLGDTLAFQLGSVSGLGLTALDVGAAGPDGDMLGAFTTLGIVPYAEGCDGCADTSGGCGGCDSQGRPTSPLWLVPLLIALRRRRTV